MTLLLLGLSCVLTLSLAQPAREALLEITGATTHLTPRTLRAAFHTGLPNVEVKEIPGYGYSYVISFDDFSYGKMGTAQSMPEVYWRAFEETIKGIKRNN